MYQQFPTSNLRFIWLIYSPAAWDKTCDEESAKKNCGGIAAKSRLSRAAPPPSPGPSSSPHPLLNSAVPSSHFSNKHLLQPQPAWPPGQPSAAQDWLFLPPMMKYQLNHQKLQRLRIRGTKLSGLKKALASILSYYLQFSRLSERVGLMCLRLLKLQFWSNPQTKSCHPLHSKPTRQLILRSPLLWSLRK